MTKSILSRIKSLWELPNESIPEIEFDPFPEPFIIFPCEECNESVSVMSKINPGQAVVIRCPNCDMSWTVFLPQLVINKTKELPGGIQEKVWGGLSETA